MARYIPLSANRRLIIINHYLVYRLRVHSHASLSLLCRCSLELRKSQRRPVVCAHLTYKEGEASVLLHSRGLQVQGIIAFTRIGVSLPLWSFRRKDRSYPLFSFFFFRDDPSIDPSSWPPMILDASRSRRLIVRPLFVRSFSPFFFFGSVRSSAVLHAHGQNVYGAFLN